MTLKDIDTKRLLYDPKSPDFVTNIKSKINEFKNYVGSLPDRKLFTYIVLMYDISSPLWRDVLDYYERKRVAAEISELPTKKGKWTSEVEDILLGTNEQINAMIVEYALQFGQPELLQLLGNLSLLSSETRKTISFKGNKDSLKIISETGDEIRRLSRVVFHSGEYDEITAARNALYAKVEKERQKLKPEDIVRAIAEDEDLSDFNPYGNYQVEKSKFLGDEEPSLKIV